MPGRLLGIGRSDSPARSFSFDRSARSDSPHQPSRTSSSLLPQSPTTTMDSLKRHSLAGIGALAKDKKRDKDKAAVPPVPTNKPSNPQNALELFIESPPNVFYGKPQASSGVLFSGSLRVKVTTEPELVLTAFTMKLIARITAKKPVVKDCLACQHKDTALKEWTFIREAKTLKTGSHAFPFSHLIPGHLPATSDGHLAHVQYSLLATAVTQKGDRLSLQREIPIARSLPLPPEKNSLRVFPPTELQVHLSMVPIIHPIGRFPISFRLSHIKCPPPPKRPDMHTRWIIRKLTWKLEEAEHMISPACPKHVAKVGGEGRGKEYDDVKIIQRDDLFEGFKTDYTAGEIDCEFPIVLTSQGSKRILCDVDTGTGYSVKHGLIIELIIAEEWQSNAKSDKWGATGQARVLRAQFGIQVTERAGLGIAWDEEEPPLYEDMGQGPPPDYQLEFGLPPLTDSQRQQMASQARDAAGRPAPVLPASPPVYGVNSQMATWTGPPLEDVIEDLNLDEHVRRPSPMRTPGASDDYLVLTPDASAQESLPESSSAAAQRQAGQD